MCLSTDGKKRIKKGVKTDEKKNQKETFLSSCSCISFLIRDAFRRFLSDISDYVKPEVNDDMKIIIEKGRHPVIEESISDGIFVSNDTR